MEGSISRSGVLIFLNRAGPEGFGWLNFFVRIETMRSKRAMVLSLIFLGTVSCDQVTKVAAREYLEGAGTLSYLGDTVRLVYAENYGAFLGMGSTLPATTRTVIFVGMVTLFLGVYLVWLFKEETLSRWTVVASGLVIGGGIGNLIDRVFRDGGVTDFMNLGIGALRTGIFNVADIWIVAGVVMLAMSPEFREGFKGENPGKEIDESVAS